MADVVSGHDAVLALAGAAAWGTWSAACGYTAHRMPDARLDHDGPFLRLRGWERCDRFYERCVRVKAWKDRLPEAGNLFRGGFSKRRVERHDREYLERFLVATRRAERAHWLILALAPTFLLWIALFEAPWWLAATLCAYGVVANVPCIVVQRYNRARLERILAPRARAGSAP